MQTINGIGTTLYGRARKQVLEGADRMAAEQAGFHPESYQAIKWFVFLYVPVIPLGTYRVMKVNNSYWDTQQYSMLEVEWDWGQVARHYVFTLPFVLFFLAVLAGA